jgi:hypothetical protein
MDPTSDKKLLRIGLVQNGLVSEERVIAAEQPVTIGTHEDCTFRVAAPAVGESFTLFAFEEGGYRLCWREGFTGSVSSAAPDAEGTGKPADFRALAAEASVGDEGVHRYLLSAHDKGKVRVADTFFLFHFIPAPVHLVEPGGGSDSIRVATPALHWTGSVLFQNDAQRLAYERVRSFMEQQWGRFGSHPTQPYFALDRGSARAVVRIDPWHERDAIVRVISWVVTGARTSDASLLRFLLECNHTALFGAFGLDPEGDVFFTHSMVGSTLDQEELVASVESVLEIADQYDDEIQRRWGGMRALDSLVADEPTADEDRPQIRKFTRIQLAENGMDNCVRGLPIPVSAVLELIQAGKSLAEIQTVFPAIEPDDVEQVRAFGGYLEATVDRMLER